MHGFYQPHQRIDIYCKKSLNNFKDLYKASIKKIAQWCLNYGSGVNVI